MSARRTDFTTFANSIVSSTVGGVKGSGTRRIKIQLQSCSVISRENFTLFASGLIGRSSRGMSRLLNVSWMQKHCGCEFSVPTANDIGLLIVHIWLGILKPSGNGLYIRHVFVRLVRVVY
jgi:hypothetical protein